MVGSQVEWGEPLARNTGATTVTLTAAHLVGDAVAKQGADQLWLGVQDVTDGVVGGRVGLGDWKGPHGAMEPLAGYEIAPGHAVGLTFALEVQGEGRLEWTAVRIDYTANGVAYTVDLPTALVLCVPEAGKCV